MNRTSTLPSDSSVRTPGVSPASRGIGLRLCAYLVLPTACIYIFFEIATFYGDFKVVFRDNRLVEWSQVLVLVATAYCLYRAGRKHHSLRNALYAMTLCMLLAVTRELDNFFEKLFVDNAWKVPAAGILVVLLCYYFKNLKNIHRQIRVIITTRGFMLMFSGFFIVLSLSRLIGQKVFWKAIMHENYLRIVKRVCEETSEFAGYVLILAGVIELWLEKPGIDACSRNDDIRPAS